MSKQVNSLILPDVVINEMEVKIKETRKEKVEVGFALCRNIYSNIVVKGSDCTGTECSIKDLGTCPKGQIHIGDYHTHPVGIATLSIVDMITGCDKEIECVGSVPFDHIRCFTRKTDKSQCSSEIGPFEEAEYNIIERGEEMRKMKSNPTLIAKTGILNVAREFYQLYNIDVPKHHTNRFKLLQKHFNRTDIK